MTPEYIRKNEIHEKYLLKRLSNEELQAYLLALEKYPEAQRELQEVEKFFRQMRSSGNDFMRREIEEQVSRIRTPLTDWSVLYKAAAVFLLFILLPTIIYYQLYQPRAIDGFSEEFILKERPPQSAEIAKSQSTPAAGEDKQENIEIIRPLKPQAALPLPVTEAGETNRPQKKERPVDDFPAVEQDLTPEEISDSFSSSAGMATAGRTKGSRDVALNVPGQSEALMTRVQKKSMLTDGTSPAAPTENAQLSGVLLQPDAIEIPLHPPREYIYILQDKKITLLLFHDDLLQSSDSLETEITGDPPEFTVKLIVPDSLWQYKENEISLLAKRDERIDITFGKKRTYLVFINSNPKWSYMVK